MKVEKPIVQKEKGRGCGQSEFVLQRPQEDTGLGAFRDQNKGQEAWSIQEK